MRTVEAALDANGTRDNEKRGYAAHWWKNYLLLCDWLPNEEKIQIRGPAYDFLHKDVYGEAAKQAGKYLSYKTWMECKAEGLVLVAALLKGSDPKRLRKPKPLGPRSRQSDGSRQSRPIRKSPRLIAIHRRPLTTHC